MPKYKKIDVTEQELEELIRRHADAIEEGLIYVDHQKRTRAGRFDVLLVDSGKSLVLAELKVVEDDGMLWQAVDYYDYVCAHVEAYARLYKDKGIDPTQQARLFLIAPSFSQTLINRCKWLKIPMTLFIYSCLQFEGNKDLTPVFNEQSIPSPPTILVVHDINGVLSYITDPDVNGKVKTLLGEIKLLKTERISIDPTQDAVSMKIDGRVFGYIFPRRKHYLISTYDTDEKWTDYPIHGQEELDNVLPLLKAAIERRMR